MYRYIEQIIYFYIEKDKKNMENKRNHVRFPVFCIILKHLMFIWDDLMF